MTTNNDESDARIQTGASVDSLTAPTTEQRGTHTPTPWRADSMGMYVFAADEMMVCQIRGWGHLTGKGGGLGLSEDVAIAIQKANAAFIVRACNHFHEVIDAAKKVRCGCTMSEIDSGHLIDCHMPELEAVLARAEGTT